MALPSNDIAPSELFLRLIEAPFPSDVVDFPRIDESGKSKERIRIRVINSEMHEQAKLMAHERVKSRGIPIADFDTPAIRSVLDDATARELIAMACYSEEGRDGSQGKLYLRIFRDAQDVNKLRVDEVAVLWGCYQRTQAKYGPFECTLTDEEEAAWVERLVRGGSAHPLSRMPLPHLEAVTFSLARKQHSLFGILASQWSTLPDTLKSLLEPYSTAIASYGSPVESSGKAEYTETSAEALEAGIDVAKAFRGES